MIMNRERSLNHLTNLVQTRCTIGSYDSEEEQDQENEELKQPMSLSIQRTKPSRVPCPPAAKSTPYENKKTKQPRKIPVVTANMELLNPIHSLEISGTMPLTKVNNGRVQDVVTKRGNTKYRATSLSIFIKFKEAFKVVTREVVVVALLPVIGTERCGAVVPPNPKVEPIERAL